MAQDGQQRSLTNEAAQKMFASVVVEYKRNVLPPYDDESEITLLRQIYLLREPLEFRQLIGNHVYYTPVFSKSKVGTKENFCNSAMFNLVMRRGKHFVIFNVTQEAYGFNQIEVRIVRPLPGLDKKELVGAFFPV